MGCGQKAWSDDEDELRWAVEKVGLRGDKKYDIGLMSNPHSSIIVRCARANMGKAETIKAIIFDKHQRMAEVEFREEMKDREALEKLKATYG